MNGSQIQIEDETTQTTWQFETSFLSSNWQCIWGQGCKGILDEPAEELCQGCCSVGAELVDLDEARRVAALAAVFNPDRFQYATEAAAGGVFSDETRTNTRVIDGACIFLNRPGFSGGAGCALQLSAEDDDCSPIDYKPSVCWQLPIKIDWNPRDDGGEVATLRAWKRRDWGEDGKTMAWCCTEEPEAYRGNSQVVDSLRPELEVLVGREVYVKLRQRVAE